MANVTWKPDADGEWSQAGEWSGAALPVQSDNVIIATPDAHTVTHSTGADAISELTVTNDTLVMSGGSLSISSLASFGSQLSVIGGALRLGGNARFAGPFLQTNGTISISQGATLTLAGTAQFGPYGTGDIDGPGTLSTTGTTTVDEGVYIGAGLTWSNSGTVDAVSNIVGGDPSGGAATLLNLASASFDLTGDYLNVEDNASTGNASQPVGTLTFVNQGTLAKTGGGGSSTVSVALTNTGTVQARAGMLLLSGAVNNSGVLQGMDGGDLDVAGALTGSGDIVVDGGSEVEVGSATSEAVVFTGAGTLQLDAPTGFAGTIYGFNTGAKIVLGGAQVTGISLRGAELVVSLAGGGCYTLAIDGLQSTTPDLVVTTVSAPGKTLAGVPTTVTWADTNNGGVAATEPFVDQVYAVSDPAGDNPQLVGSLEYNGTLNGGQILNRSLDVTLPAATSGTDYFLVKTDALNQVANDGTGPDRQGVSAAVDVIPTATPTHPPSISSITPGTRRAGRRSSQLRPRSAVPCKSCTTGQRRPRLTAASALACPAMWRRR